MRTQLPRSKQHKPVKVSLQNTSQLLARHIENFQGSSILVVGYVEDSFGLLLQQHFQQTPITFFNFDYAAHRNLRERFIAAGLKTDRIIFDSWYVPPMSDAHDVALVYLPKSRGLIEMTLMMVAGAVHTGGKVFLVGENSAGIRSSKSRLENIIGAVTSADAARHSVLYRSHREMNTPARARLEDWIETFRFEVRGMTLEVRSLPGVFSHGRLDEGTRFFLEHLEMPEGVRVLDFGCGAGVIGLAVKRLWPHATVDMVDSNALALESSRLTMKVNGFPQQRVRPSDVFSDVEGSYDRILSNPPFHTGVQTGYRVVEEFFRDAAKHLEKKGSLVIVANRFLKYRPLIEKFLGQCRVIADNNSYRVYEGTRV